MSEDGRLRNLRRLRADPEDRDSGRSGYGRLAVDLLTSPWPYLLLGVPIVVLFLIFQPEIPTIVVPRPAKVLLAAAIVSGGVAAFPADRIVSWLYDPPKRIIVQPALSEDEGGIWEMTPASFEALEVVDGQLYEWPGCSYPTYEVERYDEEAHVAVGTWRGSASDGEMIDSKQEIDEVRTELEAKARERDVLVTRAERIVREQILANTRQLIHEYNRATIVDVEELQARLDEAMGDKSLEGQLERFKRQRTDPQEDPPDPDHEDQQPVATPSANDSGGPDE